MKKIIYTSLFAATMLFFYECSSTKTVLTAPTSSELTVAQKRWPDATQQSLNDGYVIYTTKCNTCHELMNIPKRSEKSWEHEITDMAPKAKLTASEKETLRQYILSTREAAIGQLK